MLVATQEGNRTDAFSAEKGPTYFCPHCNNEVILKKGRKVVHHFAHKPPVNCAWAKGETRAHMESKVIVADALKARGLRAELEFVVDTMTGDRRADVMAWSPNGQQIAFEMQHSPIGLEEIERRATSYARAGIAQIWVPFIKPNVWTDGYNKSLGVFFVERYSPRQFERWVHGFNSKKGMWMYDLADKEFWLGHLEGHQYYVEQTSWYSEGGEENSAGGFFKYSKRYRELTLEGPNKAGNLRIAISNRRAFSTREYNWPAARVASFELV